MDVLCCTKYTQTVYGGQLGEKRFLNVLFKNFSRQVCLGREQMSASSREVILQTRKESVKEYHVSSECGVSVSVVKKHLKHLARSGRKRLFGTAHNPLERQNVPLDSIIVPKYMSNPTWWSNKNSLCAPAGILILSN